MKNGNKVKGRGDKAKVKAFLRGIPKGYKADSSDNGKREIEKYHEIPSFLRKEDYKDNEIEFLDKKLYAEELLNSIKAKYSKSNSEFKGIEELYTGFIENPKTINDAIDELEKVAKLPFDPEINVERGELLENLMGSSETGEADHEKPFTERCNIKIEEANILDKVGYDLHKLIDYLNPIKYNLKGLYKDLKNSYREEKAKIKEKKDLEKKTLTPEFLDDKDSLEEKVRLRGRVYPHYVSNRDVIDAIGENVKRRVYRTKEYLDLALTKIVDRLERSNHLNRFKQVITNGFRKVREGLSDFSSFIKTYSEEPEYIKEKPKTFGEELTEWFKDYNLFLKEHNVNDLLELCKKFNIKGTKDGGLVYKGKVYGAKA